MILEQFANNNDNNNNNDFIACSFIFASMPHSFTKEPSGIFCINCKSGNTGYSVMGFQCYTTIAI